MTKAACLSPAEISHCEPQFESHQWAKNMKNDVILTGGKVSSLVEPIKPEFDS